MKKIKLTKIEGLDNSNDIPVGFKQTGWPIGKPTVGKKFCITTADLIFITDKVKKIINKHTFKTKNSVYRWEELN